MLRITSSLVALLFGAATIVTADPGVLAQRGIVSARAVLPPRNLMPRQDASSTCDATTDTMCPDRSGCCPKGAACFKSDGIGLCSVTCSAAQPTCVFGGVTACCKYGDTCGKSFCEPSGAATIFSSMGPAPTTSSGDTTTTTTSTALETATVTMISPSNNFTSLGAFVNSTTSSTPLTPTTTFSNSASFTLGSTATGPLQVTLNAAPENGKSWGVGGLFGLVLFGFVL